jgi:hypothetical protein
LVEVLVAATEMVITSQRKGMTSMPEMPVREERGGGVPGWVWVVIALVVLAIILLVWIL